MLQQNRSYNKLTPCHTWSEQCPWALAIPVARGPVCDEAVEITQKNHDPEGTVDLILSATPGRISSVYCEYGEVEDEALSS